MVREALASSVPAERKKTERESPQLEPVREFIDSILEADSKAAWPVGELGPWSGSVCCL